MPSKTLFHNISKLICVSKSGELKKAGKAMRELALIDNAFMLVEDDLISGIGSMHAAPTGIPDPVDCTGRMMLPGFVDAHTHVLYCGNRAEEFAMRASGKTYVEIAKAGGGIQNSLKAVRDASEEQLIQETLPRINEMLSHGTTTLEIKSGYGLTKESELKMLRAIRSLQKETPISIHTTFLGAHDIPPEFKGRREDYIQLICNEMIPEIVEDKLATYCDVFCDDGYFTPQETETICMAAKDAGLKIRLHANELAKSGGVQAATALKAISADHLLCVEEEEIQALKNSSTMPILLPGTAFFLKLPYAPARQMMDAGLPIALATDANPGSCTALSIPFIMNLATTQMNILPSEAVCAATLNAAFSLGVSNTVGSLEEGKAADFILTQPMSSVEELSYGLGRNPCWRVYKNGRMVSET